MFTFVRRITFEQDQTMVRVGKLCPGQNTALWEIPSYHLNTLQFHDLAISWQTEFGILFLERGRGNFFLEAKTELFREP